MCSNSRFSLRRSVYAETRCTPNNTSRLIRNVCQMKAQQRSRDRVEIRNIPLITAGTCLSSCSVSAVSRDVLNRDETRRDESSFACESCRDQDSAVGFPVFGVHLLPRRYSSGSSLFICSNRFVETGFFFPSVTLTILPGRLRAFRVLCSRTFNLLGDKTRACCDHGLIF